MSELTEVKLKKIINTILYKFIMPVVQFRKANL